VRAKDEKGKPMTKPADFWIDTTICMNCGLCAEFCPFDAIKMNHDYEIAAYHRMPSLVFDLQELRVPTTYYARLRPTDWAAEEAARRAEAEAKAARAAARPAAAPAAAPAATAAPAARAPLTPEEIERRKAEVAAKRAAAQAAASPPPAPAGDGQEEK
jgi:NADH-quinone oxidoreductase subunit I